MGQGHDGVGVGGETTAKVVFNFIQHSCQHVRSSLSATFFFCFLVIILSANKRLYRNTVNEQLMAFVYSIHSLQRAAVCRKAESALTRLLVLIKVYA